MRTFFLLATASLALSSCALQTGPATAGQVRVIEQLRGCWIRREPAGGEAFMMLRLLPDPLRTSTLFGIVSQNFDGVWTQTLELRFDRAGRWMEMRVVDPAAIETSEYLSHSTVRIPAQPAPSGYGETPVAFFGRAGPEILVKSDPDRIGMYWVKYGGENGEPLIEGQRDGCD